MAGRALLAGYHRISLYRNSIDRFFAEYIRRYIGGVLAILGINIYKNLGLGLGLGYFVHICDTIQNIYLVSKSMLRRPLSISAERWPFVLCVPFGLKLISVWSAELNTYMEYMDTKYLVVLRFYLKGRCQINSKCIHMHHLSIFRPHSNQYPPCQICRPMICHWIIDIYKWDQSFCLDSPRGPCFQG